MMANSDVAGVSRQPGKMVKAVINKVDCPAKGGKDGGGEEYEGSSETSARTADVDGATEKPRGQRVEGKKEVDADSEVKPCNGLTSKSRRAF